MQDGYSNMGSALMQKFYFCAFNFPPTLLDDNKVSHASSLFFKSIF